MKRFAILSLATLLLGCQTINQENITPLENEVLPKQQNNTYLVIGGVESVYIPPFEIPFQARIDTGAATSSIDAQNITPFERDGEKWISFDIVNKKTSQKHHFEKPIVRKTSIIRTFQEEKRYVVHFDIKMGEEIIDTEFTLNDRSKFEYQVLIGRNILNGRFIVDSSIENTLH